MLAIFLNDNTLIVQLQVIAHAMLIIAKQWSWISVKASVTQSQACTYSYLRSLCRDTKQNPKIIYYILQILNMMPLVINSDIVMWASGWSCVISSHNVATPAVTSAAEFARQLLVPICKVI